MMGDRGLGLADGDDGDEHRVGLAGLRVGGGARRGKAGERPNPYDFVAKVGVTTIDGTPRGAGDVASASVANGRLLVVTRSGWCFHHVLGA